MWHRVFSLTSFEYYRHCQTGTLLKVHNVTYFPDGRSVVECSGVRRFKTTNCRVKDGYNVAKLNYIVDRKPRDETATEDLSDKVSRVCVLTKRVKSSRRLSCVIAPGQQSFFNSSGEPFAAPCPI